MIFDYLIPKLEKDFLNRNFRIESSPKKRIIFSAAHPEFGDIEIHDDGDELTIYAGNFTHGHFSNYDEKLSKEQKAEQISKDVIEFLKDVFADQIVFWGSHRGGGGWHQRGNPNKFFRTGIFVKSKKEYIWSGPLP